MAHDDETTSRRAVIGDAVADMASKVGTVASDASSRIPEVANTTRVAIEGADRGIRAASDDTLAAWSALSFGLASGLLVGGANRLLVAIAMLPAAILTLAFLDRTSRTHVPTSRRMQGG
jgi:ribose/xylose/arabinose/galactoside ABC-type transport system permease subunit